VLAPARYLADFARFTATKRSPEHHDAQALSELQATALALPPGLDVAWLGVSGYRMTHEGRTLFVDPYVSRVPLSALIRGRPALPDPAMIDRFIGTPSQVEGVLVGHTHFDHAVDAPAICERFGCRASRGAQT
jgi:glyoxylase-like metal-dependent hydrolase (beta-lactamase superfamily II)